MSNPLDALREVDVRATSRNLIFSLRWWQLVSLLGLLAIAIAVLYTQAGRIAVRLDTLSVVVVDLQEAITGHNSSNPSILGRLRTLEIDSSEVKTRQEDVVKRLDIQTGRLSSIEETLRDGRDAEKRK